YQADISTVAKDASAFLQTAVENAATLEQAITVAATVESASATKKIVAITACPTGVAHTFMAAEALEEEGKRRGHQI
ncbi:PTS fructose transporter subunit EIIBC, partial [Vibrio astriarenae]